MNTNETTAPLFSIIVATYNAERTLQNCLNCIRAQNGHNFELLVIDGGSKDDTVSIIRRNADIVSCTISERDAGIYDAWNKGLKLAKGEWILFVGADDYLRPDAIESYTKFLAAQEVSGTYYISSKVQIISETGVKRRVFGWPWDWRKFRVNHNVAHPASLHHRELFRKWGAFNTGLKIAGDYELLLRPRAELNALFMDKITLDMTEGGVSTNYKVCIETRKAQLLNHVSSRFWINAGFVMQLSKLTARRLLARMGVAAYLTREFGK